MKTEIIKVTPAIAESWLKKNIGNRTISDRVVAAHQSDMTSGTWKDNGDTIKFDKNGLLLDGQHRLVALVKSKVTLNMVVVTGLEPEVFDTIDMGRARTAANSLERGMVAHHERVAKAICVVKAYDKGIRRHVRAEIRPNKILEEMQKNYPDMPDAIEEIGKTKSRFIPRAILDGLFYILRRLDPEMALEYAVALRDGVGLDQVPCWLPLRERLIVNATAMNKMEHVKMLALIIKGWNFARRGSSATSIPWTPEKEGFPEAI